MRKGEIRRPRPRKLEWSDAQQRLADSIERVIGDLLVIETGIADCLGQPRPHRPLSNYNRRGRPPTEATLREWLHTWERISAARHWYWTELRGGAPLYWDEQRGAHLPISKRQAEIKRHAKITKSEGAAFERLRALGLVAPPSPPKKKARGRPSGRRAERAIQAWSDSLERLMPGVQITHRKVEGPSVKPSVFYGWVADLIERFHGFRPVINHRILSARRRRLARAKTR